MSLGQSRLAGSSCPLPCTRDQAIGAVVFDRAFGAGLDGQFLGGEELLAVDLAIDDPAVHVALASRVGHGNGFQVMVVLEVVVGVAFPIQLLHEIVEVVVILLWHVLDQQGPGDFAAFDQRLIHAENIAAPLRLISAEGTGRVQDAGADEPAGAGLEAVGLGESRMPLSPLFQFSRQRRTSALVVPGSRPKKV